MGGVERMQKAGEVPGHLQALRPPPELAVRLRRPGERGFGRHHLLADAFELGDQAAQHGSGKGEPVWDFYHLTPVPAGVGLRVLRAEKGRSDPMPPGAAMDDENRAAPQVGAGDVEEAPGRTGLPGYAPGEKSGYSAEINERH